MRKRIIIGIGAAVAVVAVLVVGGLYAWTAQASDVSKPSPTPDTDTVSYHVVGTSMDPTIADGDTLLAKASNLEIVRNDIIILKYPKDETRVYCRRVVGVVGDKVTTKYYSNVKMTTIYTIEHPEGVIFPAGVAPMGQPYGEHEATVGAGEYYVVGDNAVPGGSYDSDEWGLLPAANVVGKVLSRTSPNPRKF